MCLSLILQLKSIEHHVEYPISRRTLEKRLDGEMESFNANEKTSGTRSGVRLVQVQKRVGGVRGKNDRISLTVAVHCRHVNNRQATSTKPGRTCMSAWNYRKNRMTEQSCCKQSSRYTFLRIFITMLRLAYLYPIGQLCYDRLGAGYRDWRNRIDAWFGNFLWTCGIHHNSPWFKYDFSASN